MQFTNYFSEQILKKRAYLKLEWIKSVLERHAFPDRDFKGEKII